MLLSRLALLQWCYHFCGTMQVVLDLYQSFHLQFVDKWRIILSAKNHWYLICFGGVILECHRGPVFWDSVCTWNELLKSSSHTADVVGCHIGVVMKKRNSVNSTCCDSSYDWSGQFELQTDDHKLDTWNLGLLLRWLSLTDHSIWLASLWICEPLNSQFYCSQSWDADRFPGGNSFYQSVKQYSDKNLSSGW